MKINSFNFLKNNSTTYKNNLKKCSEIFKNLFNNKEINSGSLEKSILEKIK